MTFPREAVYEHHMNAQDEAYEEHQRALNPHRDEDIQKAAVETVDRLRRRGVKATEREAPEDLADLLTAIELFEAAVQANGGDLFVDHLKSSEPDDPRFQLPRRERGEAIRTYIGKIDAARAALVRPAGE